MKKPVIDFVGIGAQKAGTTWLYSRLLEQEQFSLLPVKEIHFFDRDKKYPSPDFLSIESPLERAKDANWTKHQIKMFANRLLKGQLSQLKWQLKWDLGKYDEQWYRSLFRNLEGIKGEITPSYSILEEEDIRNLKDTCGEPKIIFLMRDPIDRAWSSFRFSRNLPRGIKTSFDDIDGIISYMDNPSQDLRSNYIKTIEQYSTVFEKDKILLGFYDAVIEQPENLLKQIVSFIGGDVSMLNTSNLKSRSNVSETKDIPEPVYDHLQEKYKGLINELSETYGSYCSVWANRHYGNGSDLTDSKATILLH